MSEEQATTSSATPAADHKEVCDDENLHELVMKKLNLSEENPKLNQVMKDLSFDGLIEHWKEHGFKNIVTMVGAGISTAAGIPDFRSPGSGLYANLQRYELEHPEDIFDLSFFHYNPKPFFALAKELYPGTFRPTSTHFFVHLLHQKGLLLRHYTQNIDTLERVAGIPEEKLVEAHGTFYTNHCTRCARSYTMEWMKEKIFNDELPRCEDARCKAVVKPDIVFFGEGLPSRFHRLPDEDFKKCDLLIIMGTSLEVYPFAGLIERPKRKCVRLLINKYKVGSPRAHFPGNAGLMYDNPKNRRDVAYIGSCDEAVWKMATELGWADELRALEKEFVLKGNPDAKLAKSPSINVKEKQKESKASSESKPKT